ncbi:MAG: hypothetical protein J6A74_04070 [Oscillospiraceae bacterium]|nr:hypothetical protein [Oscillospiraceae bacterium]
MKFRRFLAAVLAALTLFSLTACAQETPAGKTVTLGQMQGSTYTNTYAGFACTLDGSWTCQLAQEAQELPEYVTDLKADNEQALTSLLVNYQKHSPAAMKAFMAMTEEQVVDSVLKGKDTMIDTYKKDGIDATVLEKVKVQFAGQEHFALHMEATIQGVPYYTTQLFVYGQGLYGVTLTVASFMADKSGDLLDLFAAA